MSGVRWTEAERKAWVLGRAQAAHVARMYATELLELEQDEDDGTKALLLRAKARTATDIANSIGRLEMVTSYVQDRKRQ